MNDKFYDGYLLQNRIYLKIDRKIYRVTKPSASRIKIKELKRLPAGAWFYQVFA